MKRRVLQHLIGSMPYAAELALANALNARRMRVAERRPGNECLHGRSERYRAAMNRYRVNRTWNYSGSTPPFTR